MITPDQLKANDWREFSWNNGSIMEYWKPLGRPDDFDFRLGVRFGEYKKVPPIVYLHTCRTYTPLLHVRNYEQLHGLYARLYNPHYQDLQDYVLGFK